MSADHEVTGAASRDRGESPAAPGRRQREELQRRVSEGYYLTPHMAWEVARRIVERDEL